MPVSGTRRTGVVLSAAAIALLAALLAPRPAAADTVWLCKPGIANNPCEPSMRTTAISPSGQVLGTFTPPRARNRKVDCFYIYPTVSDQPGPNANLNIDPELRSVALYQAARYSQVCRVFAPVYRQFTVAAIFGGQLTPEVVQTAYSGVLAAWKDYLRKHNHGRGVVLIGHSQGSGHLRRLIAEEIDPSPRARRKLVSAILLGTTLTAPAGRGVGGDFQNIRTCRLRLQVRCLITFSTYDQTPPANALFSTTGAPGRRALCTNPAALLTNRSAPLRTIFPTEPFAPGTLIGIGTAAVGFTVPAVSTPWVETVSFDGRCEQSGNTNALQISGRPGAPDLHPIPDATWGLHLVDANIALGNLVETVRVQAFFHRLLSRFGR